MEGSGSCSGLGPNMVKSSRPPRISGEGRREVFVVPRSVTRGEMEAGLELLDERPNTTAAWFSGPMRASVVSRRGCGRGTNDGAANAGDEGGRGTAMAWPTVDAGGVAFAGAIVVMVMSREGRQKEREEKPGESESFIVIQTAGRDRVSDPKKESQQGDRTKAVFEGSLGESVNFEVTRQGRSPIKGT